MLQKLHLKEQFKKLEKLQEIWLENKIADKITSVGKTKSKEKEDEINKKQEIYILPEKRQQSIDELRLF